MLRARNFGVWYSLPLKKIKVKSPTATEIQTSLMINFLFKLKILIQK